MESGTPVRRICGGPVPVTATSPVPPPAGRLPLPALGIVAIVAAVVLVFVFRPHANHNEQLATDVTKAIVNNDMRPVEKEFNAVVRPRLENRAKVGRLSDDLRALGPLKAIKEDTPAGSPAGKHHFQAQFEKGTWVEDLTIDADGKISAFQVHDPEANSTR